MINSKNWDYYTNKAKDKTPLHEDLVSIENRLLDIKRQLIYTNKDFNASLIKEIYIGNKKFNVTFVEYAEVCVNRIENSPNQYSKGTISNYKTTLKHLNGFLKSKNKSAILINQVDYTLISDFDYYLLTQSGLTKNGALIRKPMGRNAANKQHQRLKVIVSKAIREGNLEKNPYEGFTTKFTKTNRTYLTEEELEQLKNHSLGGNKSLEKVRDFFLFSVFTGLRFGDASNLTTKQIIKDKNGKHSIELVIGKTGERLKIPILDHALDIMNKYDDEHRKITGYILPRITNQKLNVYLKTIAEIVGIDKELTHHVARHTFATTITLSNKVPLEIVSKLLGHANTRVTQIYAKITDDYMSKNMDELNKKLM